MSADLLCTVATPQEFLAIFPHWHGALAEHRILSIQPGLVACITGVGPVNAGIALGRILALRRKPAGVLNLGLAGSFDPHRAPLGACTLVTEEIWPEYGLFGNKGVDASALGFAQWEHAGQRVIDRLSMCANLADFGLAQPQDAVAGLSLTVAGVSASAKRAHTLAQRYNPLSENMEGFAVALACARRHIPCAALRIISNKVGSRARKDRAFPLALAKLGTLGQNLFGHEHCIAHPSCR